jgi:hypothetical protein
VICHARDPELSERVAALFGEEVLIIRLSDKTSRLHPRHVVPKPTQAYEPEVPVKVAVSTVAEAIKMLEAAS